MFHQIIVLLLIVGSLLQFLSLCRLFSVAHEHRLHAGVVKLKCRAYYICKRFWRLRSLVRVFSENDKIFRQEKKYVELWKISWFTD